MARRELTYVDPGPTQARKLPDPASGSGHDSGVRRGKIHAADGYPLAISVFSPSGAARGAVLIVPAMGVSRHYYAAFARWLAAEALLVMTFDYRGIGESLRGSLRGLDADVMTWAGDTGAALSALVVRAGDLPISWIGHSLGGQIVPLVPGHERASRVITIGTGAGYWRENSPPTRLRAGLLWYVVAPVLLPIFGYFPGKRLKIVGDLPGGVMRQWRRWCLDPDYLVGAEGEAVRGRFAEVRTPIHSISFTDDEIMSARNTESMHGFYVNAPREMIRVRPEDYGLKRIGHFGFFRAQMQDVLWAPLVLPTLGLVALGP